MLNSARKVCRVLRREGVTGVIDRLRYRQDGALMRDPGTEVGRSFVLLGQGQLKARFHVELRRHRLISDGRGQVVAQKILFNPLPVELADTGIAAIVLDDSYLAGIAPGDQALIAGLASGCHVIVGSEFGLARALTLGTERRHLTLLSLGRGAEALGLSIQRWLVYAGLVSPEWYMQAALKQMPALRSRSRVCISLPEHAERRHLFRQANGDNFRMFDGIRLLPGWKGCAWSYKTLACKALQSGARRLTICEDDASFGENFQQYFLALNRYLDRADWDVFNGVMTRVAGRPEIVMRHKLGQKHIIHTPHMMGMVFNVYNRSALEWLADWSPDAGGTADNTIDEWMNMMPGLRVITAVPFLASHREDAYSTIFGFRNTRYTGMIRATEDEIMSMLGRA